MFREPVQSFRLTPSDYARFVGDFVDAGIPVQSVTFLGYEVTLPESWPYVDSTFSLAQQTDQRCSFITNGMLLHKQAARIDALDPHQITISLDGGSPEGNDRIRGLAGAFKATVGSLRRFLAAVPRFRSRVVIASCVYDEANYRSLLELPSKMRSLGLCRWLLGIALTAVDEGIEHLSLHQARPWLSGLAEAAARDGIAPYFVDLPGDSLGPIEGLDVVRPGGLESVYRLDPSGAIRSGSDLMTPYDASTARVWDPQRENAAVVSGHQGRVAPTAASESARRA